MKQKLRKIFYLFLAIVVLMVASYAKADEIQLLPEFTDQDRVLIIAPHPDDEAIGTAGVIQKALKAGAKSEVARSAEINFSEDSRLERMALRSVSA